MYDLAAWGLLIVVGYFVVTTPIWLVVYRFVYMKIVSRRLLDEAALPDAKRVLPERGHEECEFVANDGRVLRGSYIRGSAPVRRGVVLFLHELTGNRWNALPYVADLRERGWDVFTFDFRSHGQSDAEPNHEPKPWLTEYDRRDAHAALDYLLSRPDVDSRAIVAMGVSRGAGTALVLAADRPEEIAGVVTDGAYPVMGAIDRMVRRFMAGYTRAAKFFQIFPAFIFYPHLRWAMAIRSRQVGVSYVLPEKSARSVRQPVLMIYGERDIYVTEPLVKKLAAAVAGPVTVWQVPNARHNGAVSIATSAYHQRLAEFVRPLGLKVQTPTGAPV